MKHENSTPQSSSMTAPLTGEPGPEKQPMIRKLARSGGAVTTRGRPTFTIEDVRKRGLIWDGHSLPYNPNLIESARSLRKAMTIAEKKIWYDFLRNHQHKFYRQRPIDHFIADFYCSGACLIIEIDGSQHYTKEGLKRDAVRADILSLYGLEILRFTNADVMDRFDAVYRAIDAQLQRNPTADGIRKGKRRNLSVGGGVRKENQRDPSVAVGDSFSDRGAIFGIGLSLQGRWREAPVGSVSHARSTGGAQ
jgi:very-short-patch-repair endonuclease